jgi:transposase
LFRNAKIPPSPLHLRRPHRRASVRRFAHIRARAAGQTEGQINKLKTLKRAMYGRAGVDLLRARMMPL